MSLHENLVDRLENVEQHTSSWHRNSDAFIASFTSQLQSDLHWPARDFDVSPKHDVEALGLYFTLKMTLSDGDDHVERAYRFAVSSEDGIVSEVFMAPEGAKKFPGGHKVNLGQPATLKPIEQAIEKDFAGLLAEMKEKHTTGKEACDEAEKKEKDEAS